MNSEWKRFTDPCEDLIEDKNYLVAWEDKYGHISPPHIAYRIDCHILLLHSSSAFPIEPDWYFEIPTIK